MSKVLLQGLVAVMGGLGALVAFFFMVMGPLISTPTPTGAVLVAALAYPFMLAVSAVVGVFRFRLGLVAAFVALACAIGVMASAIGDDSLGEVLPFATIIAAPALIQMAICGFAVLIDGRTPST